MNRRGFLGGVLAALAAPAIIRTPIPVAAVMPGEPGEVLIGDGIEWRARWVTPDWAVIVHDEVAA